MLLCDSFNRKATVIVRGVVLSHPHIPFTSSFIGNHVLGLHTAKHEHRDKEPKAQQEYQSGSRVEPQILLEGVVELVKDTVTLLRGLTSKGHQRGDVTLKAFFERGGRDIEDLNDIAFERHYVHVEVHMIAVTNAIINPWTMVIEPHNASIANAAMSAV